MHANIKAFLTSLLSENSFVLIHANEAREGNLNVKKRITIRPARCISVKALERVTVKSETGKQMPRNLARSSTGSPS